MARPIFYPTRDQLVTDPYGSPVAGQTVRIYTAPTGGTQITDLLAVNPVTGATGSAVPSGLLISDGNGFIPAFASVDGGRDVVYADCGPYGSRTALVADPSSTGAQIAADPAMTGTYAQLGKAVGILDPRYVRGLNLGALSNSPLALPGVLGTDFFPPLESDMAYFGAMGLNVVRLPILWERLQPTLNSALDTTYKGYIDAAIALADKYGMATIIDLHNFGGRAVSGTARKVTDAQLPLSAFSDFWTRAATAWKDDPRVWGYDTMNEPGAMPYTPGSTDIPGSSVSQMHRAAIAAIRGTGSTQWILIDLDAYSGAHNFVGYYGSDPTPWWTDTLGKTAVSAHYYMDFDHTGGYNEAWTQGVRSRIAGDVTPLLAWGQARSIPLFFGEYSVPAKPGGMGFVLDADVAAWSVDLETLMQLLDAYGAGGTYWGLNSNSYGLQAVNGHGAGQPADYTTQWPPVTVLRRHLGKQRPTPGEVRATYALADPATVITRNADGSIAAVTQGGIATTYTRNGDGSIATQTRLGVTRTYSRDGSGSLIGIS